MSTESNRQPCLYKERLIHESATYIPDCVLYTRLRVIYETASYIRGLDLYTRGNGSRPGRSPGVRASTRRRLEIIVLIVPGRRHQWRRRRVHSFSRCSARHLVAEGASSLSSITKSGILCAFLTCSCSWRLRADTMDGRRSKTQPRTKAPDRRATTSRHPNQPAVGTQGDLSVGDGGGRRGRGLTVGGRTISRGRRTPDEVFNWLSTIGYQGFEGGEKWFGLVYKSRTRI